MGLHGWGLPMVSKEGSWFVGCWCCVATVTEGREVGDEDMDAATLKKRRWGRGNVERREYEDGTHVRGSLVRGETAVSIFRQGMRGREFQIRAHSGQPSIGNRPMTPSLDQILFGPGLLSWAALTWHRVACINLLNWAGPLSEARRRKLSSIWLGKFPDDYNTMAID